MEKQNVNAKWKSNTDKQNGKAKPQNKMEKANVSGNYKSNTRKKS